MTTAEPATMRGVPMPERIAALPRDHSGYPVPFFASVVNGKPELRLMTRTAVQAAIRDKLCWVCGQPRESSPLGVGLDTFVIGPMCIINRISGEPPSHPDCAEYAARVCPFLARPNMVRRTTGLPDERVTAPGALPHNPGVTLVYTTGEWSAYRPDPNHPSLLYELGEPTSVSWWTQGRPANFAEVWPAVTQGLGRLYAEAAKDDDPASAIRDVTARLAAARKWLPATAE